VRIHNPPLTRCAISAAVLFFLSTLPGCVTVHLSEQDFLFPDTPPFGFQEAAPEFEVRNFELLARDGIRLEGRVLDPPDPTATVVYFGGNMFKVKKNGPVVARSFAPMDVRLVLIDYRGYGESQGHPDIQSLRADAHEILAHVHEVWGDLPVIAHGHSMGAFMAAELASDGNVDAVVLEAAGPNVQQLVRSSIPILLRPFVRLKLSEALLAVDSVDNVTRFDGPVLVLAGQHDRQAPPRLGRQLADAAPHGRFAIIPGAGHNNIKAQPAFVDAYSELLSTLAKP
jgi:pimeloyl-ACP methyl ester carboxylesterase